MVGTSHGENMDQIQEQWLVQRSSKTLGRWNDIEETDREDWQNGFITLTDSVYICTKIKLNYVC